MNLKIKTSLSLEAAEDKKALDVIVLDLREYTSITDFFMICSGKSTTQVQSIAEGIFEILGKKGLRPLGIEGENEAKWILMDYDDLVIHVFHEETRSYYDLERLWGNAPRVDLKDN